MKILLILLLFTACGYEKIQKKAVVITSESCFDDISSCYFRTIDGDTVHSSVFCEDCIVGDSFLVDIWVKK